MIEPASPFSQLLEQIKEFRIFFEPLKGNNGDALIRMGMMELFDYHGIVSTDKPDDADIILLCGGGAMNDEWPTGAAQVLDDYMKRFPQKRFVVGPSSYYFTHLDLAAILNQVDTEVALYCREERSMELLKKMELKDNISLSLSPDLAFELKGSSFIAAQKEKSTESLVLCAMRKDREGNAGVLAKVSASWLPGAIRKPLSKLRDRLVATKSSGVLDVIIAEIVPPVKKDEIVYRDISVSVEFEDFCDQIRNARVIITNRLHIAIFGSLLGKEVKLLPGSYHKIEGVYHFSLKENPQVRLFQ